MDNLAGHQYSTAHLLLHHQQVVTVATVHPRHILHLVPLIHRLLPRIRHHPRAPTLHPTHRPPILREIAMIEDPRLPLHPAPQEEFLVGNKHAFELLLENLSVYLALQLQNASSKYQSFVISSTCYSL